MPSDFIVTTGHSLKISMNPPESYPTLSSPIPLTGSSTDMKVLKMPVCMEGDELPQMLLSPQPYSSPIFRTTPGMGTVKITLGSTNKTSETKNRGKAILITGQPFQVEFNVTVPATYVNEATGAVVTDSVTKKTGTAAFVNANTSVKAE